MRNDLSETGTKDRDLIAETRERFVGDVSDHALTVLRDDGVYRHLRFQKPGTSAYYFDLVTWPGHLAVAGDMGDYVFARTTDMFEFFVPVGERARFERGINPQYWSEKLRAPAPDAAMRYSHDLFKERVLEWFGYTADEMEPIEAAALRSALEQEVLADWLDAANSEHDAHLILRDFEHAGIRIHDAWEWQMREYHFGFLWVCWAIVWGIGKYREATA